MYEPGRIYPLDNTRGIVGAPLPDPAWYALLTRPGKEQAARAALRARGVQCIYPRKWRRWNVKGRLYKRRTATVTQIVYAKFSKAPHWDVLKLRGIITGVISRGNVPIVLAPGVIRDVMGLPAAEDRLARAAADLARLHPGDKARLQGGLFEGHIVDVTASEPGRVYWQIMTDLGMVKGSDAPDGLDKVRPD